MPKYSVEVEYAGYSRGRQTYLVDADSADEAMSTYWNGQEVDTNEVRNDWEREAIDAELLETVQYKPTITITLEEYEALLEQSLWVRCLEDAGVDNWSGYDYAIEALEEAKAEQLAGEVK